MVARDQPSRLGENACIDVRFGLLAVLQRVVDVVKGRFEPLDQFLTAGGGRDACHEAAAGGVDHLGCRALADAPSTGTWSAAGAGPVIPISATVRVRRQPGRGALTAAWRALSCSGVNEGIILWRS